MPGLQALKRSCVLLASLVVLAGASIPRDAENLVRAPATYEGHPFDHPGRLLTEVPNSTYKPIRIVPVYNDTLLAGGTAEQLHFLRTTLLPAALRYA